MKDYFKKIIAAKQKRAKELRELIKNAQTADEVRSYGGELTAVEDEAREAQAQLTALEQRENDDPGAQEQRGTGFDPNRMTSLGGVNMNPQGEQRGEENDPRGTMEYRTAFMKYIQRGEVNREILQFERRDADATGTASDLNVLIPTTVIQEIIQGVEKVYGQLYSRVRKTNVKGGVKYPIGSFSATFHRITETTKSYRQDAGGVTGYVEFSYNIGEIRLARTLLQTVLSVPVFEQEFAKVIVEAYVKAMDKEIMVGNPSINECTGILTEAGNIAQTTSRFYGLSDHIIEFTEEDMADWTSWQTKLFAKIPLSMRGLRPEFVMTANTYEANIKTLKDNNNRPVYNETFNPVDGSEIATFKGKPVVFVENDILDDFDTADNGDYFGMYWVPNEAYAINSNMEFTVMDYFDHETNQYVKKALVINDGKVLDAKYIYLLKKSSGT